MITKQEIKTRELVDTETGEVIESTTEVLNTSFNKKVTKDNFIMVYLNDVSGFLKIDNATQIALLALIWKEVNYNNPQTNDGNTIVILKDTKERWCEELKVALRTIENSLAALVKKGLLLKSCKGKYKLNPNYYFKGSSTDREKVLNLTATYTFESSKEFETEKTNYNN